MNPIHIEIDIRFQYPEKRWTSREIGDRLLRFFSDLDSGLDVTKLSVVEQA